MPGTLANESLEIASSRRFPVDAVGATPHLPRAQLPTNRPSPLAAGFCDVPLARPESSERGLIDSFVEGDLRFEELAFTSAILASGCDDGKATEKFRGSGAPSVDEGLG